MHKVFLIVGVLFCLYSSPSNASELRDYSRIFQTLADITYSADRAYELLNRTNVHDKHYGKYDADWRMWEKRLEHERILAFVGLAGISERMVRDLRKEYGWDILCKRYHIDLKHFAYGLSPYDKKRNAWRGNPPIPPGLAKKGGLPPGQAKKMFK